MRVCACVCEKLYTYMCVYIYALRAKANKHAVSDDKTAPRAPADAARTEGARSHCRPAETDRAAAARQ